MDPSLRRKFLNFQDFAIGFNRRKMEDECRRVAQKEAASRRATDAQLLEDTECLIAWNDSQEKRMPMLFSPTIGAVGFLKLLELDRLHLTAEDPDRSIFYGVNLSVSGQPLEAIPEIEQAMRLDPASSPQFLHFLGMAYLLAGKYETAAVLLRQRIVLVPRTDFSRALLASALGHLGEVEEARQVWKELKEINPNYAFAQHVGRQHP